MQLAEIQSNKTMSSREIATLCEKQHGHVCRDIEQLNQTYEQMGLSKIGQGYYTHPSTGSQQHREFLLTKEQSIDLVTGYRADIRIRINRRWQELENQQQIKVPQTLPEALRLAADLAEQNTVLQLENQTLKPKADAYDRFLDSDGLMTSGAIGKLLGYKSAQEFNDAIHAKGVAFKSSGVWQFYASFKDKHIGKMVGWEREEFNKAGVTLKWKTVAIDYFSSLLGRPVVQKELPDA